MEKKDFNIIVLSSNDEPTYNHNPPQIDHRHQFRTRQARRQRHRRRQMRPRECCTPDKRVVQPRWIPKIHSPTHGTFWRLAMA
ncbi:hypothetical protein BC936DRAFT_143046 [Jimgerdemannia flammicorona]|uniref:Uncharacterized protein n=2 Tax=Jimgerdemannia flammicorona TaxID=994334 RepID=A0A433Q8W6_9FUNG|nr:hypothetical protein BC936DRAFT_143046 [Jimgerdemannia flammicorona]RUS26224.1 hypothetical protein BC938DRAFT_471057 [Jimgerdemannia flammicorona]